MAGPERPPLRRRFLTRVEIEAAHRSGEAVTLGPDDVITHEAAQRAADLGVAVVRPARAAGTAAGVDRLREAVRAAVVAELGTEPPGLDAAIDDVLNRHRR